MSLAFSNHCRLGWATAPQTVNFPVKLNEIDAVLMHSIHNDSDKTSSAQNREIKLSGVSVIRRAVQGGSIHQNSLKFQEGNAICPIRCEAFGFVKGINIPGKTCQLYSF